MPHHPRTAATRLVRIVTIAVLSMSAISDAAAATHSMSIGPRLVGVHIDVVDIATNAVVANGGGVDVITGVATSTFSALIGPGTSRVNATGTAQRQTLYGLALTFAGTTAPPLGPPTGRLPAERAGAGGPAAFFSSPVDTRTLTAPSTIGDTMLVDSRVMTASIVGDAGPRLVGVDLDLFDPANNVRASDAFGGVDNGTAQRAALLDIAPAIDGVPLAVEEPGVAALLAVGFAALAWLTRRRPRKAAPVEPREEPLID